MGFWAAWSGWTLALVRTPEWLRLHRRGRARRQSTDLIPATGRMSLLPGELEFSPEAPNAGLPQGQRGSVPSHS